MRVAAENLADASHEISHAVEASQELNLVLHNHLILIRWVRFSSRDPLWLVAVGETSAI